MAERATFPIYVCVVKLGEKFYLLIDDEGAVLAGEKQRMLDYWTDGWEQGLRRGGGFHAGAMLSFIQIRPSVFLVESIDELVEIAGRQPPYDLLSLSVTGCFLRGIECYNAESYWENGEQPIFFRK